MSFLFFVAIVSLVVAGLALLSACIDGWGPWHYFRVSCPVCGFANRHAKEAAESDVTRGFGTKRHEGPVCERCGADLAEQYLSNRFVAGLVAEAQRIIRLKAEAEAYNAAVKTARKGAA